MRTLIALCRAALCLFIFTGLAGPLHAAEKARSAEPTVVPLHEYMKILREYYGGRHIKLEPERRVKTAPHQTPDLSAWERTLNEAGRFQAVDVFGGKAVLILDTRLGHIWIWALPSVIYAGRVFPGEKPGQEILSIPAP